MERRKTTVRGGHPISVLLKTNDEFERYQCLFCQNFKLLERTHKPHTRRYLEQHSNEETFREICWFKLRGVQCPYLSIKKGLKAVWGEGAPKRGLAHLWGIDD